MNGSYFWSTNTGASMRWAFIQGRHLWFRPYFTNCTEHVLLVQLGWFARLKLSDRTAAVLWGALSRICCKLHAASLCISYQAISCLFTISYFIGRALPVLSFICHILPLAKLMVYIYIYIWKKQVERRLKFKQCSEYHRILIFG